MKIGIFHSDEDNAKANRIIDEITGMGFNIEACDFHGGTGDPIMDVISEFVETHQIIYWLATHTSLKDEALMKACGSIAQHRCIMRAKPKHRFVILISSEVTEKMLPPQFRAYTPLYERDIQKKVTKVVNIVRKEFGQQLKGNWIEYTVLISLEPGSIYS